MLKTEYLSLQLILTRINEEKTPTQILSCQNMSCVVCLMSDVRESGRRGGKKWEEERKIEPRDERDETVNTFSQFQT